MLSKISPKYMVLILAIAVLFLGCTSNSRLSEGGPGNRNDLIFGSSVDGSYGYVVIEAMSRVLNNNLQDIRTSSVSTNGGTENIVLLFNNAIDGGHSNSTDLPLAYQGKRPFPEQYEPIQLFSYGSLTQIMAVHPDSGIDTLEDLEGRRVVVGPIGSGLETVMTQYFEAAGINIVPVNIGISETGDAFISRRVDAVAMLFRNGDPYPLNMEIEAAMPVKYLKWDPRVNLELAKSEGYNIRLISPSVSEYIDDPMEVITTSMIFIVRPDMPEDVAYSITKTLVENVDDLIKIAPHLRMMDPEYVTKGLLSDIPVHPGAAKYYQEIGIWEDRLIAGER